MKEQSMNYCCDCDWAVKKGLFFKRRYCTNPEKNEGFGSHIFHPVTCMPVIKTPIDCDAARFVGKGLLVEQSAVNLKHPCPNYKGQLRGHPAIPPMKNHLPCPPRPESKKAEIFSEFLMGEVQKTKEEKEANEKMIYLETENKALKEAKEELVSSLKDFCGNFNITQLCSLFKRGEKRCIYSEKNVCAVCKTIQKHDGKDGEK